MRKILSYAKSHIYELHSIIASIIVFGLVSLIKRPIKKFFVKIVEYKLKGRPEYLKQRALIIKRCNTMLIALTICLAVPVFALVVAFSPFVEFSLFNAIMSGVFALCEYAFIDQITYKNKE